jgi:hypothetical protein
MPFLLYVSISWQVVADTFRFLTKGQREKVKNTTFLYVICNTG